MRTPTPPHSLPSLSLLVLAGLAATATVHAQDTPAAGTATEAPAPSPGQAPAKGLERVEIRSAPRSDTAERQQSTAAKTIVGREELDRMGDANVTEVLKRLPGVTIGGGRPGRGGTPRMRGLGGGYTQILINGERMPAGMSLEAITPDQVERIEIIRGPTAETGAQAIAGTINIVLRDDVRQRQNNVHVRLGHDDGHWQPGVTWTRSEQLGNFSYNLSANGGAQQSEDDTTLDTLDTSLSGGGTNVDEHRTTRSGSRRTGIHLGGRLQWRLGAGESIALMPFLMTSSSSSDTRQRVEATAGTPAFLQSTQTGDSRFTLARLNAQWQRRLDNGVRMDLKAGVTTSQSGSSSSRLETGVPASSTTIGGTDVLQPVASPANARWQRARPAAALATLGNADERQVEDQRDGRDNWLNSSGKFSQTLADGAHILSLGWDLEQGRRDETRVTMEATASGVRSLAGEAGDNLQARTLRKALWVQDEWNITPQWSVQGGLRWEGIDTRSDAADGSVSNRSAVLTPLFHAVWRPVEGGKDQVRLALTRSWRAPSLGNLIARRSVATGTNLETNADQAGNPQLKPELATGIDLAFEHYLSEGGVLSIGLFERHISQLIRQQTALEVINGESRWVSRPQNIGSAVTRGVELEAKARMAELMENAPSVELRSNLSVFRSSVDSIDGPDNRLDQQPNWTANLGADWRVRGLPLTLGANVAQTPGYAVQVSRSQRNTVNTRQVVDVYALWTFNPDLQLRLSVNNLTARDVITSSTVTTATSRQTSTTTTPSSMAWALRLEMKL